MEQARLLHWALNVPGAPSMERHSNEEESDDIALDTALGTPYL